MSILKTSLQILAVATVTAGFFAATGSSMAQRAQSEFVNRPAHAGPTFCKLDDGYGRYRHCSAGGE